MLAFDGDVVVESAGVRIRLEGRGASLRARVDGAASPAMLRRMRDAAPLARRLVPLLVRAGMTVEVFAGSVRVARAGAGIESNALGRMLNLANVRLGA